MKKSPLAYRGLTGVTDQVNCEIVFSSTIPTHNFNIALPVNTIRHSLTHPLSSKERHTLTYTTHTHSLSLSHTHTQKYKHAHI